MKPLLASHCFRYYAPELEDRVDDTDDDLHIVCAFWAVPLLDGQDDDDDYGDMHVHFGQYLPLIG